MCHLKALAFLLNFIYLFIFFFYLTKVLILVMSWQVIDKSRGGCDIHVLE